MIITTFLLQVITADSYIIQNNMKINKNKKDENIINNTLEIDIEEKENKKEKKITNDKRIQELKQYKDELLNNKTEERNKVLKLK